MGLEQASNGLDLTVGVLDLLKNINSETCDSCYQQFLPNNKEDRCCDKCIREGRASYCDSCGGCRVPSYENKRVCSECYNKLKILCPRCRENYFIPYEDGKGLCEQCEIETDIAELNL